MLIPEVSTYSSLLRLSRVKRRHTELGRHIKFCTDSHSPSLGPCILLYTGEAPSEPLLLALELPPLAVKQTKKKKNNARHHYVSTGVYCKRSHIHPLTRDPKWRKVHQSAQCSSGPAALLTRAVMRPRRVTPSCFALTQGTARNSENASRKGVTWNLVKPRVASPSSWPELTVNRYRHRRHQDHSVKDTGRKHDIECPLPWLQETWRKTCYLPQLVRDAKIKTKRNRKKYR